ncbi:MAG: DUF5985 family protein [Gemmatimonadota bacterium]|nr:DUF5985 family protein [Gemmatimonadota bacterium]
MISQSGYVLFISGALAMGYAVAALYFIKFWRQTHDRLFALFALAFCLLVIHRVLLAALVGTEEQAVAYYLLRLVAFALIAVAVIGKNRSADR